jgi:hypothetical protein
LPLERDKIKTIGFSVMGPPSGPFYLELDWIKALNTPQTMGDEDIPFDHVNR